MPPEWSQEEFKAATAEELRMGYKEKDTSKPSLTSMLINRGFVRSPQERSHSRH